MNGDGETIEDRIKRIAEMDTTNTFAELSEAIQEIQKDLLFADHKRKYWSEIYSRLRKLKGLMGAIIREKPYTCEICGKKPEGKEALRVLPDKRRVCKKCWRCVIEDVRLKISNERMKGTPYQT